MNRFWHRWGFKTKITRYIFLCLNLLCTSYLYPPTILCFISWLFPAWLFFPPVEVSFISIKGDILGLLRSHNNWFGLILSRNQVFYLQACRLEAWPSSAASSLKLCGLLPPSSVHSCPSSCCCSRWVGTVLHFTGTLSIKSKFIPFIPRKWKYAVMITFHFNYVTYLHADSQPVRRCSFFFFFTFSDIDTLSRIVTWHWENVSGRKTSLRTQATTGTNE